MKMKVVGDKRYKDTPRCCEGKTKLMNRCNRIAGQIAGVKAMIEEDRYCEDILIQLAAIGNSVKSLSMEILDDHMNTCMVENIKEGNTEVVDGVIELIKRYH